MTVIAHLSKMFRHCEKDIVKLFSDEAISDGDRECEASPKGDCFGPSALAKTVFSSFVIVAFIAFPCRSENFKYESHGKRDPFVPLVGIEKPATSSLEDITSIGDVKLEGIASSPGGKLVAIMNGEIVKEGDRFGEIQIKKITKKTVTILMGGKNYAVNLVEEGGFKSGR